MSLLADRVAVITAGSRGIGRAIAERFATEGAAVAISGRNQSTGADLCEQLGPDRSLFVQGDMTNRDDVERLIDAAVDRFGRLDIAVLNAGGVRQPAPIMQMTDDEWEYELNLNLNHTFWGIRRALPHMVDRGWGRILSVSSVEGKHGKPNVCGYVANKHAINGLTKSVAKEVGPFGVTVNAICPGLVLTDMLYERSGAGLGLNSVEEVISLYSKETALGRPVTVDEVAATALFLASELGSGITGALVSVDAGTAAY
jgi:3-hydroxybutyrate dehydrogenase/3-oxoacyl-[acyl-carrier protein] reductase